MHACTEMRICQFVMIDVMGVYIHYVLSNEIDHIQLKMSIIVCIAPTKLSVLKSKYCRSMRFPLEVAQGTA